MQWNLRALLIYLGDKDKREYRGKSGGGVDLVVAAGKEWNLMLSSLFYALVMSLECISL